MEKCYKWHCFYTECSIQYLEIELYIVSFHLFFPMRMDKYTNCVLVCFFIHYHK